MATRTPIVVGNWKLHKTISEAVALVTELKNQLASIRDVEVGVAPVFTALHSVARRLEDSNVFVAGQNCHWEDHGAFTGEVSPALLADAGCSHVIVGHSERRHVFGDTNDAVGRRVRAVLDAGLDVILCVGETEAQRDGGHAEATVSAQVDGGLAAVGAEDMARVVLAYEPVWAIGTGRTATPVQAQELHAHIRAGLDSRYGSQIAGAVRIQYGGSVKPDNAQNLIREADIDGALVGGAALNAGDFVGIVKAARLAKGA
jgi:triosephosphate isomerase